MGPHTVSWANFFAQGADFELFNCASILLTRADIGNQRIKALDENGLQFPPVLSRAGPSPGSLGDCVHSAISNNKHIKARINPGKFHHATCPVSPCLPTLHGVTLPPPAMPISKGLFIFCFPGSDMVS